ncbi:MAG TPA: SH3 domain-containing protein [Allosphingosinicella sp.]|nr:SH3 domain-containing protein [Allosphingosinicella sp.]
MLRVIAAAAMLLSGIMLSSDAEAQKDKRPPYWASISAGKAMMRAGPGKNYPATWLYVRADLPIKVIEVYPNWRRVQDPDGATGWMLVHLLSDTRTALVRGEGPREMHEEPDASSRIVYRAAPGVVGRLSDCSGEWCRLDVGGKRGFIRKADFWGTDAGESF